MVLRSFRLFSAAILLLLAVPALAGDSYKQFPGMPLDNRTLRMQERVEELFAAGEYDRALFIYEKELSPIGDKYAQYMVGYMHLTGKGTDEDPGAALAWYRLAAERREAPLVQARDALEKAISNEQRARADKLFAKLWPRYGDKKILLELIRKDLNTLRSRTGTRIPDASPRVTIVNGYYGSPGSEEFYRQVRKQLDQRLKYLKAVVEIEDESLLAENSALNALESDLRRMAQALDASP